MPRYSLMMFTAILSLPLLVAADDGPTGQKIAGDYFVALITGDVEAAIALTDAPFSLDRKRILKTVEEVHAAHREILKRKGKRPVPRFTVGPATMAPALDARQFPKYVAYRINVGDEHVDVYVSAVERPKVIGFSD